MNFTVINREMGIGDIKVTGVSTSSIFIIGDADTILCKSAFDTPPESLIIQRPFVPLSPVGPSVFQQEAGVR